MVAFDLVAPLQELDYPEQFQRHPDRRGQFVHNQAFADGICELLRRQMQTFCDVLPPLVGSRLVGHFFCESIQLRLPAFGGWRNKHFSSAQHFFPAGLHKHMQTSLHCGNIEILRSPVNVVPLHPVLVTLSPGPHMVPDARLLERVPASCKVLSGSCHVGRLQEPTQRLKPVTHRNHRHEGDILCKEKNSDHFSYVLLRQTFRLQVLRCLDFKTLKHHLTGQQEKT